MIPDGAEKEVAESPMEGDLFSEFPNGWRNHGTRSMAPSKNLLILSSSSLQT